MTTTQSIALFMTALRGQNYSPKTLRAYGDDLRRFLGWVGENRVDWDVPKRFSRVDIEGFMSDLAGKSVFENSLLQAASYHDVPPCHGLTRPL
jgi:site-specific recombinase XerD